MAIRVAVFTLANSPEERARISTIFPLSVICTLSLSFETINSRVNLPSESSAKYSFANSSNSLTRFSILYASSPLVLKDFFRISKEVSNLLCFSNSTSHCFNCVKNSSVCSCTTWIRVFCFVLFSFSSAILCLSFLV